jgi:hypothetical protein
VPRDRNIYIYIHIYKDEEKDRLRKGNSHLKGEERNVAPIKYGSPEVLFLWNIYCVIHGSFKPNFL